MKHALFNEMLKSVKQMDDISRGKRSPSRVYKVATKGKQATKKTTQS